MKRGDPGPHLAILQKMAGSDIYLRGKTEARESKERGGSRSRGDPRERGGKRVHESTARAPPKYAFRPKDPHFEIDPHDFPGIYIYIYTRSTSAISTRSASFHLGSTLASSIVLIELGRHEMLRGNFSNRAPDREGKTRDERQRREEKLAYLLFLVFLPPFRVFLSPRDSIFIFIPDFSTVAFPFIRIIRGCRNNFQANFFFLSSAVSPFSIYFVIVEMDGKKKGGMKRVAIMFRVRKKERKKKKRKAVR